MNTVYVRKKSSEQNKHLILKQVFHGRKIKFQNHPKSLYFIFISYLKA